MITSEIIGFHVTSMKVTAFWYVAPSSFVKYTDDHQDDDGSITQL
jgi:hypothetical protein